MPIHLLQIAKKLAHDAGQLALKHQEKGFSIKNKESNADMVTSADKACEELIINTVKKNFPEHQILSEESGFIDGKEDYKWIIDPIDGTTNFAHGIKIFSISIAIIKSGKPVMGIVEIPAMKETFWAGEGRGAFLNDKELKVSKTKNVNHALLATGFPYEREERYKKNIELMDAFYKPSHGIRRMGAASIDLCYVAAGRYDGYWEYGLKPWDIAAGKIILEEAGGTITNMDGNKLDPKKESLLATNGIIHQEMLDEIKKMGGDKI